MSLDHTTITILVAEDEALLRLDLLATLLSASYEVLEACNGHEALEYLQHRQRVDVVITDIQLGGGLTGWDVAMPNEKKQRSTAKGLAASGCRNGRNRRFAAGLSGCGQDL